MKCMDNTGPTKYLTSLPPACVTSFMNVHTNSVYLMYCDNFIFPQSGYFKSLFQQGTSSSVTLPTVPAEYFAILLSGMHSGSFTLTNDNVYQVSVIMIHS